MRETQDFNSLYTTLNRQEESSRRRFFVRIKNMKKNKIAIYNGPGTQSIPDVESAFRMLKISYVKLDKRGIKEKLNDFQVFLMPGGITEKYISSLSKDNFYQIIREFISKGGKYIGICGGVYFASKDCIILRKGKRVKARGLGIINVRCLRETARRRPGRLRKIKLKKHRLTQGSPRELNIWYRNGPIIIPKKRVTVVANYENNLGAIAFSKFGKGKVILISPHPEGEFKKAHPKKLKTLNLLKNAIYY